MRIPLLLLLALTACSQDRAVVSDLHGDRWEIVNPHTGHIDYTYDVDGQNPDLCRVHDDNPRFCLIYQSRHRVTTDGHDEVAYTVTPVGAVGESQDDVRGRIFGVRPTGAGEVTWTLDRLDWSGIDPAGDICRRDPTDPCRPAPDAADDEVHACNLYWPHDFRILSESDDALTFAIADTRNDRIVWASLPKSGGTCATVTEVLDHSNPAWDVYASVNAVEVWEEDGRRELLLSAKTADPHDGLYEGQVQGDRDGKGKIVQWEDDGSGWRQVWEHPPQSTETVSFVNSPHGIAHDDGRVYFAHALGQGDAWETSLGGSVGVLDRSGRYLYDAIPARNPLLYTRSVATMADGTLLVTDSGTKGDEKEPADTALYVLQLPDDLTPAAVTGAWSADHAEQRFVEVPVRSRRTPKDSWVMYSADPIAGEGSELSGS